MPKTTTKITPKITPKITIITALYNHEKYFMRAAQSMLEQTFHDWEWIIWDDASTDSSLEMAKQLAARYSDRIFVFEHPENFGQERTRNEALKKARGEWIGLLDSDDFYSPKKLESLIAKADAEVGLVYGLFEIYSEQAGVRPSGIVNCPSGDVFRDLLKENFIGAGACLFRKQALENSGASFDTRFRTIGEYPLWIALAKDWKFVHVPIVVAFWREHESNLGTVLNLRGKKELLELFVELKKKYPTHMDSIEYQIIRRHYDLAIGYLNCAEITYMRRELQYILKSPIAGKYFLKSFFLWTLSFLLSFLSKKSLSRIADLKHKFWQFKKDIQVRRRS